MKNIDNPFTIDPFFGVYKFDFFLLKMESLIKEKSPFVLYIISDEKAKSFRDKSFFTSIIQKRYTINKIKTLFNDPIVGNYHKEKFLLIAKENKVNDLAKLIGESFIKVNIGVTGESFVEEGVSLPAIFLKAETALKDTYKTNVKILTL